MLGDFRTDVDDITRSQGRAADGCADAWKSWAKAASATRTSEESRFLRSVEGRLLKVCPTGADKRLGVEPIPKGCPTTYRFEPEVERLTGLGCGCDDMNGLPVREKACKGQRIYTAFTATGDERVVGVFRSASAAKKAFKPVIRKDPRARGPFCQRSPEKGEKVERGARYVHGAKFLKVFNRLGFVVGAVAFIWIAQSKGLEEALRKLSPAGAKIADKVGAT